MNKRVLMLCVLILLTSCFQDNNGGVNPAPFLWKSGEYHYVLSTNGSSSDVENVSIKVLKVDESTWKITETTTMKLGGKWMDIPFQYELKVNNNTVYQINEEGKSIYFISPLPMNTPSWEIEGEQIVGEETLSVTSDCKVLNVLATEEGRVYQFSTQCEYDGDNFKYLDIKTFRENEGLVEFSDITTTSGKEDKVTSFILKK